MTGKDTAEDDKKHHDKMTAFGAEIAPFTYASHRTSDTCSGHTNTEYWLQHNAGQTALMIELRCTALCTVVCKRSTPSDLPFLPPWALRSSRVLDPTDARRGQKACRGQRLLKDTLFEKFPQTSFSVCRALLNVKRCIRHSAASLHSPLVYHPSPTHE